MVLFFTNIIAPYRIGLFNNLNELLNNKIIFYFDAENESNRKWKNNEEIMFKYYYLKSPSIKKYSNVANNTKLYRTIYFPYKIVIEILKKKPNIIISSELGLRSLFSIIGGKSIKSKIILFSDVTCHSEKDIKFIKRIYRKFLILLFDGAIAHGYESKKYLIDLGLKEELIEISPYSVNNEYYIKESKKYKHNELIAKYNYHEDCFIFFYSGQFIHRKGLDLLIKIIQHIQLKEKINIKLLLAGGDGNDLNILINNYNKNIINTLGFLQKEDIVKYYKIADCFILPTRLDTWGLVVNEAIACGCPVAVSKFAGCAVDLIEDRIDGYIFNPLDENNFYDTIIEIIQNKKHLPQMAELAKEKLKVYNHSIAAESVGRLINKINNFL